MSDSGEVHIGDGALRLVAGISEFTATVLRKSRLFLKSGAEKSNTIFITHLFHHTNNTYIW